MTFLFGGRFTVPAVLVGKDQSTTEVDKFTLLSVGTRSVSHYLKAISFFYTLVKTM